MMAPRRFFIFGLAVCTTSPEAHKIITKNGIFHDTAGFLGRVFGSEEAEGNQAVQQASAEAEEHQAVKQSASGGFIKRSVVDDEGSSLGNHHGAITVETCRLFCETTDGCKSFTFKSQRGKFDAWCHLKDKCINENTPEKKFPVDAFSTFYKKYIQMTWTERTLVADEGNTISNHEHLSLDKCKQRCHADLKCKSLSFGQDWCLLKEKCVTAEAANAIHGYVKLIKTYYMPCATSGSATWHQRSLVEVEGGTLAEETLTQRECEIKCDANPLCNSFSYKTDSKMCRLYDKVVTEEEPSKLQPTDYNTYYKSC